MAEAAENNNVAAPDAGGVNNAVATEDDVKQEEEDDALQAPSTRLRSCEPDLKVVVKYVNKNETGSDGGEDPQLVQQKEYYMYANLLAKLSNFVDTCLSVDMKEKAAKEIVFQDVTPKMFELALKFLEDPVTSRSMTVQDAIQVVEFYDQFAFVAGIKLCDQILLDYFKQQTEYDNIMALPKNMNLLVDAMSMAMKLELPSSKPAAIECLKSRLYEKKPPATFLFGGPSLDYSSTYGPIAFDESHVKKLQPFLWDILKNTTGSGFGTTNAFGVETKEEMGSSLFPKLFVQVVSLRYAKETISTIALSGTSNVNIDGQFCKKYFYTFAKDRPAMFDGQAGSVAIAQLHDWRIEFSPTGGAFGHTTVLWRCPHSHNFEVPPKGPWVPVHDHVQGTAPTISYE